MRMATMDRLSIQLHNGPRAGSRDWNPRSVGRGENAHCPLEEYTPSFAYPVKINGRRI